MYSHVTTPRLAPRHIDPIPGRNPAEASRRALERVRKALVDFHVGAPLNSRSLRAALALPEAQPDLEATRLFALGWLHWLDGAFTEAEPPLVKAVDAAKLANATPQLAEAGYWLARVRVLLGQADAVTGFETVLRQLGGNPQATAWFVDLLWRAGRLDRAEQVWKSVRGNKKVMDCPEGRLLEARSLLRRSEVVNAARLLADWMPTRGVLLAERALLLAWTEVAQNKRDRAAESLDRAEAMPYPRTALELWRRCVETYTRPGREDIPEGPPALRDLLTAHAAILAGRRDQALIAYRAALAQPAAAPFARYALALLGQERFDELLAAQPGLFVAVRCRVWLALEKFRTRQTTPAEWLEAIQHEARLGFTTVRAADHFRRVALVLRQSASADALRNLLDDYHDAAPPIFRNFCRAALEQARRLSAADLHDLLNSWARFAGLSPDDPLRIAFEHLRLRLDLLEAAPQELERLLSADASLATARQLWQAARALSDADEWRERVRGLRSTTRWKPLAEALLLQEAAQRGDAASVLALLDEVDVWRLFRPAPPRFILRAVDSAVRGQPTHPGWRRAVGRWLGVWEREGLGADGATLALHAGLTESPASSTHIPDGVDPVAWLLHQATRALGRHAPTEALACLRRARAIDPELTTIPDAAVVREALPELERRALAEALSTALCPPQAGVAPEQCTDLVDQLRLDPQHAALLDAAMRGDAEAVRAGFARLGEDPTLSPPLAHHLALLEWRAALALDGANRPAEAVAAARRSWLAWLRFLATNADHQARLVGHLLAHHRQRITELLARVAVDDARRHWSLVAELPALAARHGDTLQTLLTERVELFRDELATDYLTATRELMRYGDIPEGFHADYEKGLSHLRRLLSLDRDNVRLLTTLVEVCGELFLDLYNAGDPARLAAEVERYAPFALQLARHVEGQSGNLPARAALSEFFKFRGFVAADRAERVAMYRAALRFNPANGNVRELLTGLGESIEDGTNGPAE